MRLDRINNTNIKSEKVGVVLDDFGNPMDRPYQSGDMTTSYNRKRNWYSFNERDIVLDESEIDKYKIHPSELLTHELGHSEVLNSMNKGLNKTEKNIYTKNFTPKHYILMSNHDLDPYERKSDVNALRYHLFRKGLFDPKTGKYKTKSGNFEESLLNNQSFYNNRMKRIYDNKDIVEIMNKVAFKKSDKLNHYA